MIFNGIQNRRVQKTVLIIENPVLSSDVIRTILHGIKTIVLSFGIFTLGVFILNIG